MAAEETIADICAEMRGRVEPGVWIPWAEIGRLADRIEAAWKAERKSLVYDAECAKNARNHIGIEMRQEFSEKCAKCSHGNAAALRKAAGAAHELCVTLDAEMLDEECERLSEVQTKLEKALAAPARNCDRFETAEAANEALQKHCHRMESCRKCSFYSDQCEECGCGFAWLFAPAEGGAK
jgi:hypothetical protein